MDVNRYAHTLLFGTTMEDKLLTTEVELGRSAVEFTTPSFPGRPREISTPGKARFPALERLHDPVVRGEVLHFFANHELLAMELMALVLLKFPEAPEDFRRGIVRTIQEEQSHLRLYLERMKELGVSFGDLPVSDYFWKALSPMQTPMDFVVQMSLTFEQANLDFSLFYMNAVKKVGDEKTATILERVFREEIGHVKNGVVWFNRWRENSATESDWDAYLRLLPPPMTPRRAKGVEFCADARKKAGLSENFIRELELYSGSKGRPPVIWKYNPHCESEVARGKPGFTATEGAKRVSRDLNAIPLFLASPQDTLLVEKPPRAEWIESLKNAGFETPEFLTSIRAPKLAGFEPWGWSPDSFEEFRPFAARLVEASGANGSWCREVFSHSEFQETGIAPLFSKAWSSRFFKEWLEKDPEIHFGDCAGSTASTWEEARNQIESLLFRGAVAMTKAPYGTSGMQIREVRESKELDGPIGGWIKKTLESQGEIVIEELLKKVCDLSIQIEVEEERTKILDARRFVTGSRNEYRGTYLGKGRPGFSPEELRFLHSCFEPWNRLLRDLGEKMRKVGYQGPAGVDALLWKTPEGALRLKPLVELNPRWTMGRVALELEKHIHPSVDAFWSFLRVADLQARGYKNAEEFAREMREKHPIVLSHAGAGKRIESGVVFTNDPATATEVLTMLSSGPSFDNPR